MTAMNIFSDSSDFQIEVIIVNIQFAINIYNLFGSCCKFQYLLLHNKKKIPVDLSHHVNCSAFSHPGLPYSSEVYRKKPEKENKFHKEHILLYKDLHKEDKERISHFTWMTGWQFEHYGFENPASWLQN